MLLRKTYRYRVYPTAAQEAALRQIAGCCRLVYNLALEQRRLFGRRGRSFSYISQANELPALKRDFAFLQAAPSHCLQQTLRRLDRAYASFFAGRAGYPRIRRRGLDESFCFPDPAQIKLDAGNSRLILPKFGKRRDDHGALRLRLHRPVKGRIKTVVIRQHGGHWYAALSVEVRVPRPVTKPAAIGIDRGVAVQAAFSDGHMAVLPVVRRGTAIRMKRLQQRLARQVKGSRNRTKNRLRIARLHARVAARRRDAVHRITRAIADRYGLVALEYLQIRSMTRSARGTAEQPGRNVRAKARLNRAILGATWGEMETQLAYKMDWTGGRLVKVPAHHTSQTCAACGAIDPENRLSQSRFVCVVCGHEDNADVNAAKEILKRGIALRPGEGLSLAICGDLGTSRSLKQRKRTRTTRDERAVA